MDLEEVLQELNERNANLRSEYDAMAAAAAAAASTTQPVDVDVDQAAAAAAAPACTDPLSVEASKLRQHTSRMEARIAILLDHNRQVLTFRYYVSSHVLHTDLGPFTNGGHSIQECN